IRLARERKRLPSQQRVDDVVLGVVGCGGHGASSEKIGLGTNRRALLAGRLELRLAPERLIELRLEVRSAVGVAER
ncbi:hypothetical protein COL27_29220, partial [Bacillus sp. AFS075960]